MKKFISVILALLVIFSSFTTAFADELYQVEGSGATRKIIVTDLEEYICHKHDEYNYPFIQWGDLYLNDKKVTEVTIPGSLENFNTRALSRCQSIEKVTVEEGVKVIGKNAFYQNTNLKSISLPSTLERIEQNAFLYCRALKEIKIPDSVTYIKSGAFFTNPVLESITVPFIGETAEKDERDFFGEIFSGYTFTAADQPNVKYVTLSSKCTTIPDNAFDSCPSIEKITISASVTTIGKNAFDGCGDDVVIKCYKGSAVDDYCKKNNVKTEYLGSVCSSSEHKFSKYTVTTEPSCTQKGSKTGTCSVCGFIGSTDIPMTEHKLEEKVIKQPTCTEKGSKQVSCTLCNYKKTEEINALGHDFAAPSIIKEATEDLEGLKVSNCSRCSKVKEEVIPKLSSGSSQVETGSSSEIEDISSSQDTSKDNQSSEANTSSSDIPDSEIMPGKDNSGWIIPVIIGGIVIIAGAIVATILIIKKKKVSKSDKTE